MIQKALFSLAAAALCAGALSAQSTSVQTPFQKTMSRVDFGITGVGEFNKTVSGPIVPAGTGQGTILTEDPSNTAGVLVSIRYIHKPYIGGEFNYGYSRYAENFTPPPGTSTTFNVQSNALEYTLGYVVQPRRPLFGLQPFASAGTGVLEFKPTSGGGQELPKKARQVYYYNVGVQSEFTPHLGFRAQFRQLFFLAPDFGQNYLTILKHTNTIEPGVGFYLRF